MAFDHQIDETELLPKRATKHRFRARIFAEWNHACAYCHQPADTLDVSSLCLLACLNFNIVSCPSLDRSQDASDSNDDALNSNADAVDSSCLFVKIIFRFNSFQVLTVLAIELKGR